MIVFIMMAMNDTLHCVIIIDMKVMSFANTQVTESDSDTDSPIKVW